MAKNRQKGEKIMYISIRLPSTFDSFNRLQAENYPFNTLFTEFLDAVCKLGLSRKMAVGELVGWIEDRVFEGQRLPDIPESEGGIPVNIRYRISDTRYPDIVKYISGNEDTTNRMAVMYIARMALRLSVSYGTSMFRLKRLILDLMNEKPAKKRQAREEEKSSAMPVSGKTRTAEDNPKEVPVPGTDKMTVQEELPTENQESPAPKISMRTAREETRVPAKEPEPVKETPGTSSVMESANAAKAALSELADLAAAAGDIKEGEIVETNPLLNGFY